MPQLSFQPNSEKIQTIIKSRNLHAKRICMELLGSEYELGMATIYRVLRGQKATEDTMRSFAKILVGDPERWDTLIDDVRVVTVTIRGKVAPPNDLSEDEWLEFVKENCHTEIQNAARSVSVATQGKSIFIDIFRGSIKLRVLVTEEDARKLAELFKQGKLDSEDITSLEVGEKIPRDAKTANPSIISKIFLMIYLLIIIAAFTLSVWVIRPFFVTYESDISVIPAGRVEIFQNYQDGYHKRRSVLAFTIENESYSRVDISQFISLKVNGMNYNAPMALFYLKQPQESFVEGGEKSTFSFHCNDVGELVWNFEYRNPNSETGEGAQWYKDGLLEVEISQGSKMLKKSLPVKVLPLPHAVTNPEERKKYLDLYEKKKRSELMKSESTAA